NRPICGHGAVPTRKGPGLAPNSDSIIGPLLHPLTARSWSGAATRITWAPPQPQRIGPIHRVVVDVRIQVEAAAGVADGVGGHEALEQRVVDSPAELHERRLVGVVEHGGPAGKARFLRVAVIVVAGVDPPERLVGL